MPASTDQDKQWRQCLASSRRILQNIHQETLSMQTIYASKYPRTEVVKQPSIEDVRQMQRIQRCSLRIRTIFQALKKQEPYLSPDFSRHLKPVKFQDLDDYMGQPYLDPSQAMERLSEIQVLIDEMQADDLTCLSISADAIHRMIHRD